jgi:hypothetical protein
VLEQSVDYLRGTGPQPGSYQRVSTYPTLRGLMTWSINWDATANCAVADEYAQAYEDLFGISTAVTEQAADGLVVWPVPVDAGVVHVGGVQPGDRLVIRDALGRICAEHTANAQEVTLPLEVAGGTYLLQVVRPGKARQTRRLVVR